jgi:hypothetical protein
VFEEIEDEMMVDGGLDREVEVMGAIAENVENDEWVVGEEIDICGDEGKIEIKGRDVDTVSLAQMEIDVELDLEEVVEIVLLLVVVVLKEDKGEEEDEHTVLDKGDDDEEIEDEKDVDEGD